MIRVNEQQNLGLRERKRIETRKKLEEAAITLAIRDGLEQASIEAISEYAHVSPRTFFNYFDSKEEAILGLRYVSIPDEAIAACIDQRSDHRIVESIINLMVNVMSPALANTDLHKLRVEIIRKHPQLLERQINQKAHIAKRLIAAVQQVAESTKPQAEVLLSLCMSSIRAALREQVESGKKISPTKLKEQAIQIVNEVTTII